jgi:hypothetical protein
MHALTNIFTYFHTSCLCHFAVPKLACTVERPIRTARIYIYIYIYIYICVYVYVYVQIFFTHDCFEHCVGFCGIGILHKYVCAVRILLHTKSKMTCTVHTYNPHYSQFRNVVCTNVCSYVCICIYIYTRMNTYTWGTAYL